MTGVIASCPGTRAQPSRSPGRVPGCSRPMASGIARSWRASRSRSAQRSSSPGSRRSPFPHCRPCLYQPAFAETMNREPLNPRPISVAWRDPMPLAEAARTMPGIDFLRAIRDGKLPPPPIAVLLGFDLVEVEPGHAVFEVTPGEQHYNPIGVVHGGLAMTLLDSAMGCCVQTQMPAGSGYTTLEAKTNLVRAITSKT